MVLDNTIAATAIPRIADDFGSLGDTGRYGPACQQTTCAFELFYGKLYLRLSIKLVYLGALLFFEARLLICALVTNSPALIVGRAIPGFGAAGLFSGVLLIIARICPVHKSPVYTGIA